MNYLTLLTQLFNALMSLGQTIAANGPEIVTGLEALWSDLQAAYDAIANAISNFTAPSTTDVSNAQDVLNRVNAALENVAVAKKA